MSLFPTARFDEVEIERYNEQTIQEYVDIRDFLVLHYKATTRDNSDFWDYCRTLAAARGPSPTSSTCSAANGRVFREHNELFTETSWLAVMVGQGIEAQAITRQPTSCPTARPSTGLRISGK